MHLEGKANSDARGVEIVTWAAVGAEIQTCIRRWFERWPLERSEAGTGYKNRCARFYEIAGRSPG